MPVDCVQKEEGRIAVGRSAKGRSGHSSGRRVTARNKATEAAELQQLEQRHAADA
jgi:hypothetical protein